MSKVFIQGLCLDSRRVQPGDAFVALPGSQTSGHDFIEEAIDRGAVAVLVDAQIAENARHWQSSKTQHIPMIPYTHLRETLGYIASRFYDEPSKKLAVIGITGTNGKTTCSHFIATLCEALGLKTAVMGTLGMGFLKELKTFGLTTPDTIMLQSGLSTLQKQGANCVSIEVTSHALTQGRVAGVQFQTAIFTNLTRDHLDYHQDEEHYFQAKKRLFQDFSPSYALINVDDVFGQRLMETPLSSQTQKIAYGFHTKSFAKKYPCITLDNLTVTETGSEGNITTPWGQGLLSCPVLGQFNMSNSLASLGAVCLQGFSLTQVLDKMPQIQPVAGRMISSGKQKNAPQVVIDYAHSPDALNQVLNALKPYCQGKLWCIFGCGGERDRGKRPLMANIAETLCDKVIVTQDNSRTENPADIIQDILRGFSNPANIHIEPDRAKAILFAIEQAADQDLILVAGKGHETHQILRTETIPFSDEEWVKQGLARRSRCAN